MYNQFTATSSQSCPLSIVRNSLARLELIMRPRREIQVSVIYPPNLLSKVNWLLKISSNRKGKLLNWNSTTNLTMNLLRLGNKTTRWTKNLENSWRRWNSKLARCKALKTKCTQNWHLPSEKLNRIHPLFGLNRGPGIAPPTRSKQGWQVCNVFNQSLIFTRTSRLNQHS